jgi:hypothetical protein
MRSQPDDDIPGSPWWPAVNEDLLRWAVTVLRRRAVRVACPTPTCCTAGPIGIGPTGGPSSRSCLGSRQGVSSTQALRRPLSGPVAAGRPQTRSAKTRPVGPVSARSRRRRANQPAVFAAGRNHRPQPTHRAGYVELRGPPTRATSNCWPTSAAPHSESAGCVPVGRRDPVSVRDDRTRCGVIGCAQRRHQHRPRRRQLRDQRAQMVHFRCAEPPLRRQAWPRSGGCAPPGPPSARARRC